MRDVKMYFVTLSVDFNTKFFNCMPANTYSLLIKAKPGAIFALLTLYPPAFDRNIS